MKIRTMIVAGGIGLLAAAGMTAPAVAADDGTVTVVHGIPGLDVDVYVNGENTLPNFKPGTVTDPLTLPAGDYTVEIYKTGEGPDGSKGTAAITDKVTLPAGANVSLVAYLTPQGTPSPKLGVFVNDTKTIEAGDARVTVRHVAAAPAVTVTADGTTLIASLSNPDQGTADVPAKSYAVAVAPAAGGAAVFSTDLDLPEGNSTIVYAYGSLADNTFAVASQSISGLGASPSGVPAGEGTDRTAGSAWLLALAAVALFGALWSARRWNTAQRR
jgi:hypothetical protein